jgi:putative membrane protein
VALFLSYLKKQFTIMKNIKALTLLFAAFFFTLVSCGTKSNQDDSKDIAEEQNEQKFENTDAEDDSEFAVTAADGGMLEVQLGQLALTKASSSKVKEFAQSMIDDHSKANEELKTLAQSKNITLPTTLSEKNQEDYNDLAEKSGAEFDKAYCEFMVKDHKEDLEKFRKAAEDAEDPDLKSWAAGKVPVLEHHLSMAEGMEQSVKSTSDANN